MTNSTPISFKCPTPILERLPAAGNGRSKFIVQALKEAVERKKPVEWKPTTPRGRRMAALIEAGKHERGPDWTIEQCEQELRERKGGNS